MFSSPTPPTDNLYKFTALSGVVILGFSVFYPLSEMRTLAISQSDILSEQLSLNEDLKRTIKEINERKELVGLVPIEKLQSDLNEMKKLLDKKRQEANLLKLKKERLTVSQRFLEIYLALSVIGTIVGLGLSCFGFFFWYKRVQIFQDMQIRREASIELSSRNS
jgi:hypothetical protein